MFEPSLEMQAGSNIESHLWKTKKFEKKWRRYVKLLQKSFQEPFRLSEVSFRMFAMVLLLQLTGIDFVGNKI